MIEGMIAGVSLLLGFSAWLWHTHERVQVTTVRLNAVVEDVAGMKSEQRNLRDGHVRSETTLEHLSGQMANLTTQLQPLPAIAASLQNIASDVSELKTQIMPRAETEARFKAVESRLP